MLNKNMHMFFMIKWHDVIKTRKLLSMLKGASGGSRNGFGWPHGEIMTHTGLAVGLT